MTSQTRKNNSSYHTVMSCFGVGPWDDGVYVQAGLRLEGNTTAVFYDFGEYPQNRDNYMRHVEFRTNESPDINKILMSGRALIQFFELEELTQGTCENKISTEQIESMTYSKLGEEVMSRVL